MLICTAEGTVTGFGLANPKLIGEREAVRRLLCHQPANRPPVGSAVVTDKGLAGEAAEAFLADLELLLIRPARTDEHPSRSFPNWLRQRVEAIIWTLKHSLAWNTTVDVSQPACGPASSNACSPSTPPSGSTGGSGRRSNAP
jgi:hypothetical protein